MCLGMHARSIPGSGGLNLALLAHPENTEELKIDGSASERGVGVV